VLKGVGAVCWLVARRCILYTGEGALYLAEAGREVGGEGEAWEERDRRLLVWERKGGGRGRGWNSGRDRGGGFIIRVCSRSQVSVLIINQLRWETECWN